MLSTRLGLGCKQPCLFQLNIIKVIKCLKIHANFTPTWLQPRCACCKSLLRTVGGMMTAGGMLSWSLKGGSLGGFGLGFSVPVFHGMKALQNQTCKKWSPSFLSPFVPLSGISKSMAGASRAVFEISGSVGVLLWEAMETVAFLQRLRQGVFCSAVHFHIQSWASSPPK